MTKYLVSKERRGSIVVSAAALIVAGAVLTWSSFNTKAQERAGGREVEVVLAPATTPADLERAFWLCDYAGTSGSVDSGMGMACSTITERLKNRNFNGDFEAMLAWWRDNKPTEHRALEAAGRARASAGKAAPAAL